MIPPLLYGSAVLCVVARDVEFVMLVSRKDATVRKDAKRQTLITGCGLISHLSGGVLNGFDDVLIAGAAAQIPFKSMTNIVNARIGIAIEQLSRSHDHSRRTIAALQAVLLPETFLDRVEIAAGCHAFNRSHAGAVCLYGEHRARLNRLTVENHRAGAADLRFAANVGPGQSEHVSQVMDKQYTRLDIVAMSDTVHGDVYGFLLWCTSLGCVRLRDDVEFDPLRLARFLYN